MSFRYGIDKDKIHIIAHSPVSISLNYNSEFTELIKNLIHQNKKYIFYPAQFWIHKNHSLILRSLNILKNNHDLIIHAIFCGSDCGNLQSTLKLAEDLGIKKLHSLSWLHF